MMSVSIGFISSEEPAAVFGHKSVNHKDTTSTNDHQEATSTWHFPMKEVSPRPRAVRVVVTVTAHSVRVRSTLISCSPSCPRSIRSAADKRRPARVVTCGACAGASSALAFPLRAASITPVRCHSSAGRPPVRQVASSSLSPLSSLCDLHAW